MWRISIILNTLLMIVFGFGSAMSLVRLQNRYVQYPEHNPKPLPIISIFALNNTWLYIAIPTVWIAIAVFLLWRYSGKTLPENYAHLHTSCTLFFGLIMFSVYIWGGVLPFIPIINGMSK